MPPVRSDAELVEKLWEKISEIEDDERRLSTARKIPSGASPPEGESSISLPLGVVASLIQDKGPEEKVKPPRAESVDSKPSRTAKFGDFFIDATVPPDVCRRVEKHRDAVRRYRGLVEADLFGSDMTQTQIVDQLADELVDLLLSDVANEVGSIIDDCSETILVTA